MICKSKFLHFNLTLYTMLYIVPDHFKTKYVVQQLCYDLLWFVSRAIFLENSAFPNSSNTIEDLILTSCTKADPENKIRNSNTHRADIDVTLGYWHKFQHLKYCDISLMLDIPLQHQQRNVTTGWPNTLQIKPQQVTNCESRNKRWCVSPTCTRATCGEEDFLVPHLPTIY